MAIFLFVSLDKCFSINGVQIPLNSMKFTPYGTDSILISGSTVDPIHFSDIRLDGATPANIAQVFTWTADKCFKMEGSGSGNAGTVQVDDVTIAGDGSEGNELRVIGGFLDPGDIVFGEFINPSKNIYTGHGFDVPNYFISETGPQVFVNCAISDRLDVVVGRTLIASGYPNDTTTDIYLLFYDVSDAQLGSPVMIWHVGESVGRVVTVPVGAKQCQFTTKLPTQTYTEIQLEYGAVATAYEPYSETTIPYITNYGIDKLVNAKSYGDVDDPKSVVTKEFFDSFYNPKPTLGKMALLIGDSITDATWNEGSNWPDFFKKQTGCLIANYAYVGASFQEYASPSDPRLFASNQISNAIGDSVEPDIIIIALGRNEMYESFRSLLGSYASAMAKDIGSLDATIESDAIRLALYRCTDEWPQAKIFISLPIQAAGEDPYTFSSFFELLRQLGGAHGSTVIETTFQCGISSTFENVAGAGRDLRDGTHPNILGKAKQGRCISAAVLRHYQPLVSI